MAESIDIIRGLMDQGFTPDDIKSVLMEDGDDETVLNDAFTSLGITTGAVSETQSTETPLKPISIEEIDLQAGDQLTGLEKDPLSGLGPEEPAIIPVKEGDIVEEALLVEVPLTEVDMENFKLANPESAMALLAPDQPAVPTEILKPITTAEVETLITFYQNVGANSLTPLNQVRELLAEGEDRQKLQISNRKDAQRLTNFIAQGLDSKGINVVKILDAGQVTQQIIDPTSPAFSQFHPSARTVELGMFDETGKVVTLDPHFLESMARAQGEIIGSIAGASFGVKAAANILKLHPLGRVLSTAVTIGGALLGGASGASAGRGFDIILNSLIIQEKINAKMLFTEMDRAGTMDAVYTVVGAAAFKLGAITLGGIKTRYKIFLGSGNRADAVEGLLQVLQIDRKQAEQITAKWAKLNTKLTEQLTDEEQLIRANLESSEAGAKVLREVSARKIGLQSTLEKDINTRAEAVLKGSRELLGASKDTETKILTRVANDLSRYEQEVEAAFGDVKTQGINAMKDTIAIFNFSDLVKVAKIGKRIGDPVAEAEFDELLTILGREASDGTFDQLFQLRNSVISYKTVTNNKETFDLINKISATIDNKIIDVAEKQMPNGEVWVKQFRFVKAEWSKKKKVTSTTLFRALKTAKDIPAVVKAVSDQIKKTDGTFESVMSILPRATRIKVEASYLNEIVTRNTKGLLGPNTAGKEGAEFFIENKAIDFPAVQRMIGSSRFITPEVQNQKRIITAMSRVYRHDILLRGAPGTIAIGEASSHAAGVVVATKRLFVDKIYNKLLAVFSTERRQSLQLLKVTQELFNKPLDAKLTQKFLQTIGKEEKIVEDLERYQIALMKAGVKDLAALPSSTVFRAGSIIQDLDKQVGDMGTGFYYNTKKAGIKEGNVVSRSIINADLASEKELQEILGLTEAITKKDIKANAAFLQDVLEKRGFVGFKFKDNILMYN